MKKPKRAIHNEIINSQSITSNGSWRQGIKGEMTCTVYVALVWNNNNKDDHDDNRNNNNNDNDYNHNNGTNNDNNENDNDKNSSDSKPVTV